MMPPRGILFPEFVEHVAVSHDIDDELPPEERELITGCVPARRREFTTARSCARAALRGLGHRSVPIPRGPFGSPLWPTGVVGAITHCRGYRAAAVAQSTDTAGLGLDAEPNEPLPDSGILPLISLPRERDQLAELGDRRPDVYWERLLFSAKESVYKAWHPLTGRWLDFDDVAITFRPDSGTFRACLVAGHQVDAALLDRFDGTWKAGDGILLTAVTVLSAR